MKILKKLMCCCLFVMLLCSHGMTAYALEVQDGTAVKLIVTDETGGFSGQIVAEFYDSDSAEQVYTAVLTKENSWGGQADFTFNLDPNKTYSIVIKGLPSDYLLVNTFGDRGQVQSITVSSLANDNYWSIIKSEETNAQTESGTGADAGAEATSETTEVGSTENVKGENAEADAVYQKFLNAVSFIKDDSTWDFTLKQFGEKSAQRKSYSQWYANSVSGGSEEKYFSLTPYEQFLWTETYTKFYGKMHNNNNEYYFGSVDNFKQNFVNVATQVYSGNNKDAVISAYEELALWQYDYIVKNREPYNFINKRSYTSEIGTAPEKGMTSEEMAEQDKKDIEEAISEAKGEDDKGVWSDTVGMLSKHLLEILLIVGLGIAVAVVVYIRKNKNFDNKE